MSPACSRHCFASASSAGNDERQGMHSSVHLLCKGIYCQQPTHSPVISTLPIQQLPTMFSHLPDRSMFSLMSEGHSEERPGGVRREGK